MDCLVESQMFFFKLLEYFQGRSSEAIQNEPLDETHKELPGDPRRTREILISCGIPEKLPGRVLPHIINKIKPPKKK